MSGFAHFRGYHEILGLIVTIILITQPLTGYFIRNYVKTSAIKQKLRVTHRWVSRFLFILAFIVCVLGMRMIINDLFPIHDVLSQDFVWFCFVMLFISPLILVLYFEYSKKQNGGNSPSTTGGTDTPVGTPSGEEAQTTTGGSTWRIWNIHLIFVAYNCTVLFFLMPLLIVLLL